MVNFERAALQLSFALFFWESISAFSTPKPLSKRGGLLSTTTSQARVPIRRSNVVVISSSKKNKATSTSYTASFGQDNVESAIKDADNIGQDIFFVNLEECTPATASAPADETVMVVSKNAVSARDEEVELSLPGDNSPKAIITYTRNDTKREPVIPEDAAATLSENVGAVLAASEGAMIAAEATLPAIVKQEFAFVNGTEMSASPLSSLPGLSTSVEDLVDIIPPEDIVGEAETRTDVQAPAVMKIIKFAIPAVGVWLCSPLLSLIDTSAVGMLSGTVHQAALNPAVAVTDYAALLIAFLYTATTNLVASAQETDRTLPGKPKTTSSFIGAMQLSSYVGLGLGACLFAFARPLLRGIIGNDAINPAVFAAAMKYVRIRALGMPAAAIIGSAQAGSLGAKDIRSPLYILAAAAAVNFMGDMIFVGAKHPWVGGAAGAAWATVFSQYAALTIFIRWLVNKPKEASGKTPQVVNLTKNIMDFMSKPANSTTNGSGDKRNKKPKLMLQSKEVDLSIAETSKNAKTTRSRVSSLFQSTKYRKSDRGGKPKEEVESVRGLLAGKFSGRDLLKLPSAEVAKEFTPYVAPVTVTQIGRVSGYIAMSHVVSSSLGTISMAAQQVIVSFFYCLTPIADSLSLTAQSFIPGISERKPSKERSAALRKTGVNFMKAGGVFGSAMVAAIMLLPFLSGFFTSDPAVASLVNSVVPLLVAFFSMHGVLCAAEGVILGQKDLGFLGKMYGFYFFAVPFFMLRVKRAALAGVAVINLSSVWTVFLGYQIFRSIAWVSRVELLQRRTEHSTGLIENSL